jgi:hypothetical protein
MADKTFYFQLAKRNEDGENKKNGINYSTKPPKLKTKNEAKWHKISNDAHCTCA